MRYLTPLLPPGDLPIEPQFEIGKFQHDPQKIRGCQHSAATFMEERIPRLISSFLFQAKIGFAKKEPPPGGFSPPSVHYPRPQAPEKPVQRRPGRPSVTLGSCDYSATFRLAL
jgi:hypothetical protein